MDQVQWGAPNVGGATGFVGPMANGWSPPCRSTV